MLKAPVPSITEVKQHWAQSVLGWVTAYKRVNHTKDWLALLLARCCIASWGIDLWRLLALRGDPKESMVALRFGNLCMDHKILYGTHVNKQTSYNTGSQQLFSCFFGDSMNTNPEGGHSSKYWLSQCCLTSVLNGTRGNRCFNIARPRWLWNFVCIVWSGNPVQIIVTRSLSCSH
jgi:hypothetical protein